jgi:hypothetical protein
MKRVTYTCDICGDVVRKERTGPDVRPFIGLGLGLKGDHHKAADRFIVNDPHESERHVCYCCLAGFVALARRTLPAGTFKDGTSIN